MIAELSDGTQVECEDRPLGSGVAGITYRSKDKKHVVKIFKEPKHDMRARLEAVLGISEERRLNFNCVSSEPYWRHFMSWPDGIVVKVKYHQQWIPNLGVTAPWAPGEDMTWITFPKLYNRQPAAKKQWDKRVLIAMRLAAAVARMHRCGVAHSDLSPKNIMVESVTGGVNVIDLDGLVVPGFLPPQVLGTPDYFAPEVIAGKSDPSISTDRHALAVILYQLLLFRHPFRGPKVHSQDSDEDERLMLGESAIFIDHPHDTSNRPTKKFWPLSLLGRTLKDLFERAFVHGVKDPTSRPTANEWQSALSRLSDRIVGCGNPGCEERYFPVTEGRPLYCPWCNAPFVVREGVPALRLYFGDKKGQFQLENDYWIAGYPDRTLHEWHAKTGVEWGPNCNMLPVLFFTLNGLIFSDYLGRVS